MFLKDFNIPQNLTHNMAGLGKMLKSLRYMEMEKRTNRWKLPITTLGCIFKTSLPNITTVKMFSVENSLHLEKKLKKKTLMKSIHHVCVTVSIRSKARCWS